MQFVDVRNRVHMRICNSHQSDVTAQGMVPAGEVRVQHQARGEVGKQMLEDNVVHAIHSNGQATQGLVLLDQEWSKVVPGRC